MNTRGFTLIELLVVIAILGILGAILFVTIGGSPQQGARDSRRISDLGNLQLALELYNTDNEQYPSALTGLAPNYIGGVPADPKDGDPGCGNANYNLGNYGYSYATNADQSGYVLAACLENATAEALNADSDGTVNGVSCVDPVYCVRVGS